MFFLMSSAANRITIAVNDKTVMRGTLEWMRKALDLVTATVPV